MEALIKHDDFPTVNPKLQGPSGACEPRLAGKSGSSYSYAVPKDGRRTRIVLRAFCSEVLTVPLNRAELPRAFPTPRDVDELLTAFRKLDQVRGPTRDEKISLVVVRARPVAAAAPPSAVYFGAR